MAHVPDLVWYTETATNILLVFNSIAIWSSIPLTIRIFATLKQRRGLYFRAILATTWGLTIRSIAYFVHYFAPKTPWYAPIIFLQLGWILMVSGFATMLWSRLGFIMRNENTKRYLRWMIIFNGVVFHTAMTALTLGFWGLKQIEPEDGANFIRWIHVQNVFERIQIVVFCGQEILISSLYIKAAYHYLRTWSAFEAKWKKKVQKAMGLLLAVQAVVVLIDIGIITIDFLSLIRLKSFIHSFIYCLKLELELIVLNQLVEISQLGVPGLQSTQQSHGGQNPPEQYADQAMEIENQQNRKDRLQLIVAKLL